MAKRDYYDILGIDKSSDAADIKRAYRSLAMKFHPDKNPGDAKAAQKMKELNEAYAVLSDARKRQLYDTYGHAGLEGYSTEDLFGGVDFGSLFQEFGLGGFGLGGIFDSFFGGRRTTARQQKRGADLKYDLEITLEEAAFGVEKKIEIPSQRTCAACHGKGAQEGGLKDCEHCKGSGQMVSERKSGFGVFRQISTCSHCRGRGKTIQKPCGDCQGRGFIEKVTELSISVPGGVDTDYVIKKGGEGEAGPAGAVPGDLYVVLNVKRHPIFERHGDDIYMAQEISFTQAALGAEIDNVPSLNGNLKLDIPEGAQTGSILKIANAGITRMDGHGRGDQYVLLKVATPQKLSKDQKELLRQLDKLEREKSKS